MTNEIVNLAGLVPTKEQIEEAVAALNDRYSEGGLGVNPVREYVYLKALQTFIEQALEVARPWALSDVLHFDEKERKHLYGAEVRVVSGKSEYDYSGCDDVLLKQSALDKAKVVYKQAQAELDAVKKLALAEQRAKYVGKGVDTLSVRLL